MRSGTRTNDPARRRRRRRASRTSSASHQDIPGTLCRAAPGRYLPGAIPMLGDYYFRKLPRRVQGRVEELVAALGEIAKDDLSSVLVHGSVARGDWVEGKSDIDLIVVVK